MAFKPIDPKRDEFRRYLERAGVLESLTKVFVKIVTERPDNPLEYIRHNLGDSIEQADNLAYLQGELESTRNEVQRLREIIEKINPEALQLKSAELVAGPPIKVESTPDSAADASVGTRAGVAVGAEEEKEAVAEKVTEAKVEPPVVESDSEEEEGAVNNQVNFTLASPEAELQPPPQPKVPGDGAANSQEETPSAETAKIAKADNTPE